MISVRDKYCDYVWKRKFSVVPRKCAATGSRIWMSRYWELSAHYWMVIESSGGSQVRVAGVFTDTGRTLYELVMIGEM